MKVSQLKSILQDLTQLDFVQFDGVPIPSHFHVTELGVVNKQFIDCGGMRRDEKYIVFQIWVVDDLNHRLLPQKLSKIIELSEVQFGDFDDLELEAEFQSDTIGRFGLEFRDGVFGLIAKQTDCLAKDNCGIPTEKAVPEFQDLLVSQSSCSPQSNCC